MLRKKVPTMKISMIINLSLIVEEPGLISPLMHMCRVQARAQACTNIPTHNPTAKSQLSTKLSTKLPENV